MKLRMKIMSSEVAKIAGAAVEAAAQECRAHATQQLDIAARIKGTRQETATGALRFADGGRVLRFFPCPLGFSFDFPFPEKPNSCKDPKFGQDRACPCRNGGRCTSCC